MTHPHVLPALHRRIRLPIGWMRTIGFAAVLVLLGCSNFVFADTTYVDSGRVSGIWTTSGNPFVVRGDIWVSSAENLEIQPGVHVYFTGPFRLMIEGSIRARGTMEDSVVFSTDSSLNHEGWGGIRLIRPAEICEFEYCVFEGGRALGQLDYGLGGALLCDQADVRLISSTIHLCQATSGSAIFARNSSYLTITDCIFRQNGVFIGSGGAICARNGSRLTLTSSTFVCNMALYGGAVTVDASTLLANDCEFSKNIAAIWGGAIYGTTADLTFNGTSFYGNSSTGGGALDCRVDVRLIMDRCILGQNSSIRPGAEGPGGAILLQNGEQWIYNCTLIENRASQGGAIYGSAHMHVKNCIIANNTCGRGIFFPYSGADVRYCCLTGNIGGDWGGWTPPYQFGQRVRLNPNGDSCDVYSNIYQNPLFDDSADVGYSLCFASPCIDAGDPARPRDPDGTISDIGARWFDQTSSVAPERTAVPRSTVLYPAYPNPFNPSATLSYEIAQEDFVTLRIFDLLGRETAALVQARRQAGRHVVQWNAESAPSGYYFAVLEAGDVHSVQKLLLMK